MKLPNQSQAIDRNQVITVSCRNLIKNWGTQQSAAIFPSGSGQLPDGRPWCTDGACDSLATACANGRGTLTCNGSGDTCICSVSSRSLDILTTRSHKSFGRSLVNRIRV
mgnify:CR=1 FL=1